MSLLCDPKLLYELNGFDTIFAFGDSYSSVCGSEAYKGPEDCATWATFSDEDNLLSSQIIPNVDPKPGPNWLEFLTNCTHGSPLNCDRRLFSLAVNGAQVGDLDANINSTSLQGQYKRYKIHLDRQVRWDPDRTLFVFFIGINDLLAIDYWGSEFAWSRKEDLVDTRMTSLSEVLQDLVSRGATQYLVMTLPSLENSPSFKGLQFDIHSSRFADMWNEKLNRTLESILSAKPADQPPNASLVTINIFDVRGLFRDIQATPQTYGIEDTVIPCTTTVPNCSSTYFWYGDLHVTTRVHEILANSVKCQLNQRTTGFVLETPVSSIYWPLHWTNLQILSVTLGLLAILLCLLLVVWQYLLPQRRYAPLPVSDESTDNVVKASSLHGIELERFTSSSRNTSH